MLEWILVQAWRSGRGWDFGGWRGLWVGEKQDEFGVWGVLDAGQGKNWGEGQAGVRHWEPR